MNMQYKLSLIKKIFLEIGSAIFLHCSIGKPTAGCVAIDRTKMINVFENLQENSLIKIDKNIINIML